MGGTRMIFGERGNLCLFLKIQFKGAADYIIFLGSRDQNCKTAKKLYVRWGLNYALVHFFSKHEQ